MKAVKSVSYLEKGDLLVATTQVEAKYATPSVYGVNISVIKFNAGQTMGAVTEPNRLSTDGDTYIDFIDSIGRTLFISKTLTAGTNKTVSYQANPNYIYPDKPQVSTTGSSTGTGLFDKIGSILGAIGGILGTVKNSTGTPPINGGGGLDTGTGMPADNNTVPTTAKTGNTLWWIVGGSVVVVGGIIGGILYARNKKRRRLQS